jgi:hypothetical protein
MTMLTRLEQWKENGIISPEQHALLAGLARGEPFSLFVELNIVLYAGILAFVAGLGWTVSTWSQQLGDVLILTILSVMLATCFWYCFSRAPAWSAAEVPSPAWYSIMCFTSVASSGPWNSLTSRADPVCSPDNGISICW